MTRGANRKTGRPGRRLLEIGKDLLIAALVLVNLTLAIMCLPSKTLTQTKWLAGALRPFAGLFGLNEAELTYTAPATGSTIVGAAQPLIITLSTEAGRQSAQYDFAALDELYGQYGSLLAQALESAGTPQTCTRTEFYAALRGTGAAFCFPGAISPSVLGAWLNVRAPEGGQAQWYVLAQEEDGVTLYLAGEQFSAAKTALPAQSLTAQLETAVPDGSFFAFEAGEEPYAALDGLSLISAQSAQVSTGQSANPCDARFISALASQIVSDLQSGTSTTIEVPTKSAAAAYAPGGKDWGNRFIDIDLTEQHVRMYDASGALVWESDCVSGDSGKGHDTPCGVYTMDSYRASGNVELRGAIDPSTNEPEYISKVQYWMPFIGNSYALHDADWRSNFGGNIYTYNGSHGCVNLPSSKAAELYNLTSVGDVVVVHT